MADQPDQSEDRPELEELLQKIPEDTRELIDSLFRGQFTSVKAIDRTKLW